MEQKKINIICGVFYIDAGVAPENTEETFNVIIQELNNLKNNLNIDEVSSSKELIKGRMLMRYEDSRSVAMNYGTQELLKGKIISIDKNDKSIDLAYKAIRYGGLVGLSIYGIYNFTCMSFFAKYPLSTAIIDTMWGTFLYSFVVFVFLLLTK